MGTWKVRILFQIANSLKENFADCYPLHRWSGGWIECLPQMWETRIRFPLSNQTKYWKICSHYFPTWRWALKWIGEFHLKGRRGSSLIQERMATLHSLDLDNSANKDMKLKCTYSWFVYLKRCDWNAMNQIGGCFGYKRAEGILFYLELTFSAASFHVF